MTYNNSTVYSVPHLSKDNCLKGEMESKPNVIKIYLELYLTTASFSFLPNAYSNVIC